MLVRGLQLLGVTFVLVAFTLVLQVINVTTFTIPKLNYALAACDPPAMVGAWLAARSAAKLDPKRPQLARTLLLAAISLTIVGTIVLSDFALAYVAPSSAAHDVLTHQGTWIVVDVATLAVLGLLLWVPEPTKRVGPPHPVRLVGTGLLPVKAIAAVWSVAASVPWPFRLAEAVLFACVAVTLLRIARLEGTKRVVQSPRAS